MFQENEYLQIHKTLVHILRDRQKWHNATYAVKYSNIEDITLDSNKPKLNKEAFAWYKTLEKNVLYFMHAVLELSTLETEHLSYIGLSPDGTLTPHKIKQLVIIKLVAELGRTADDLRSVLKKSDDSVGSAVRLRRRIRWLEIKLEALTKEPLMPTNVVTKFFANTENSASTAHSSHIPRQVVPVASSPTFVVSVGSAEGESLTSSEESREEDGAEEEEGEEEEGEGGSPVLRSEHSATIQPTDATDEYWNSEHHQVEHSPLTNLFGPALPFHSLDIHRSNSYVKRKGDPSRASLPWRNIDKEYVDPNSEEKALERLSVTVQEMMGRAYNAALESVPLDVEEFRAANKQKQDTHGKNSFRRPNSILARVKGQKWMEKKFRNSIHAKDVLIYHPPPPPVPVKLLLSKLSNDVYPPMPELDVEAARQRAKEMPPRFVNQHDLLKKTHLTLYELLFDAEKTKSRVDVRKSNEQTGSHTVGGRNDVSLVPSASITRGSYDFGGIRPKSPVHGTVTTTKTTTKAKTKGKNQNQKEENETPRRLPPVTDTGKSVALNTNSKDRVYMTKSGWYRTRRMPSPVQYISLRLERVKGLIEIIKSDTSSFQQKISSVKQIAALGVSNAEVITDLVSLISNSIQRSESMDLRFEVLKVLLLLGFTEDAVLKELLVFISSSNHQILCDLLKCLRKALTSPRMSRPFGKTSMPSNFSTAPDLQGKSLNLLYISPTDCLLVHRLIQLCQCTSPELSFYAAACLRKVKVMPPPPPLAPPPSLLKEESSASSTVTVSSDQEAAKAALLAQAVYQEKLAEYEELLKKLDQQDADIAQLTENTFRQIAKADTPIVVDALQELIDGIGASEDELFKKAYDLLKKSPVGGVRAALVRLVADGFVRLTASQTPGVEFRLNELQDILLQRLTRDPDKQVCTECARTFYKLGLYEKVSDNILKNLDNKLDMETKMQAIQCAVGLRIRGSRITRALVDLLELDPNDGVRIAACRALGSVGTTDRRALAALRERYERTQGVVAREAGRALAVLTAPSSNAAFNPAFLDALVDRVVKNE